MANNPHSTFNFQHRSGAGWVVFYFLLVTPYLVRAQMPTVVPQGAQLQLQVQQPGVDVTTPVTATAEFDPPVVRPGEKTFYRVNVDATESSIQWPDALATPAELTFGKHSHGMITQTQAGGFRPLTTHMYEVTATATGHFTMTNFSVDVSGAQVEIPMANLDVVAASSGLPPPRRLRLEISATNIFLGQPFRARVILPAGANNQTEALREIDFDGDGLMTDKSAMRQSIEPVNVDGVLKPGFICELLVTPITAGTLKFSAQGFTAGREFTAPISIRGQVSLAGGPAKYTLLASDPAEIKVRPLPVEGELPGFTGAIGEFFADPPQLSTNRLRIGEPAQLKITIHGKGELSRLAPPVAPRSRNWQIIADPPPALGFTLIPLADDERATPAIPFSYFDPAAGKYVDLTIPPVPVTVIGEALPAELAVVDDEGKSTAPLKLSALAPNPGRVISRLQPLQMRAWFLGLQLVPLAVFFGLWLWDRRRRYLEAHPEIVRRVEARRALRRARQQLQLADAAGDTAAYVQHAASAMSIAVAPHFPANPRALVGGDVLAQLDDAARQGPAGVVVKNVFAAADAQFAGRPQTIPDLPTLRTGVAEVLQQLEEKL